MSLLHAIHFDAGVLPPEFTTSGGAVSTTVKRTGAYSFRLPGYGANFNKWGRLSLSSAQSEFYVQFGWYFSQAATGSTRIMRWKSAGGTVLGGLILNSTSGYLELYTGDFASLVATGTTSLTYATMYLIELYIKISDSGAITLRVDLNEDASFSGDTKPGADTTVAALDFGNYYNIGAAGYNYIDDIIVHDLSGLTNNSWPDGGKVYYLVPTGDGATKDWTPSSGSDHYALVDEVPPSATDNLVATAIDRVDIFSFGDLPGDAQTVRAVIPEIYAFKGSSLAPSRLALGINLNGEGVEYSADKDLALAQGIVRNVWEARPGGGNFSVADVNALELYLKSAA